MTQVPPPVDGVNSESVDAVPVCPRHPDRPSYVRCQRCERPTCPQCQRPAAVGFQCVDCVAEGAKTVRHPTTIFGGQIAEGALVTKSIVGLCVALFLAQMFSNLGVTERFWFVPVEAMAQPYRFLTAAFLHSPGSFMHIGFNMYALWLSGPYLEQMLGRARFLTLYLVSAIGGSVGYLLLASPAQESWVTPTVGASGAVFGLWGAIMTLNWRAGISNRGWIGLIVINAAIGFLPGLSIAWQAHLGGMVTGAAVAAVYAMTPKDKRRIGHPLGIAVVLAVLVAATAAKFSSVGAASFISG